MELARLGLQTAYAAANTGPVSGVSSVNNQQDSTQRPGPEDAVSSQPPSSTRVNISAAGQTRLAAEQQASAEVAQTAAQQSGAVAQNVPVQSSQDTRPVANEPNFTAAATPAQQPEPQASVQSASARPSAFAEAPTAQQGVTAPTGGATPGTDLEAAPAPAPLSPPPAMANRMDAGPVAAESGGANQAAVPGANAGASPARQVDQADQQQRARRDDMAQSRQDVSPVLAQGGVATYQEVLSM